MAWQGIGDPASPPALTTSQYLAISRGVLKLKVGSSWLQVEMMIRPRFSGLSINQILSHEDQLLTWIKAKSAWATGTNEHSHIGQETILMEIPINVTGAVQCTCSMLSINWPSCKLQSPGIITFCALHLLSSICIACDPWWAHSTCHCCPQEGHKHLHIRSWRWLWYDLGSWILVLPEKQICSQSLRLRPSQNTQIPIFRGAIRLIMNVKYEFHGTHLHG